MNASANMWPLKDWCAANRIGYSTAKQNLRNAPHRLPELVQIGKRYFITKEADEAFRVRLLQEARNKLRPTAVSQGNGDTEVQQ
ncbi:MAG TPA: hypothetical protein VD995_04475 [Azospirillum sp.]|nr:hypothetical protein [Azospirillum sp.]